MLDGLKVFLLKSPQHTLSDVVDLGLALLIVQLAPVDLVIQGKVLPRLVDVEDCQHVGRVIQPLELDERLSSMLFRADTRDSKTRDLLDFVPIVGLFGSVTRTECHHPTAAGG